MSEINDLKEKKLYQAILSLNNEEECRSFFSDLLTIKELIDFSSRLEVAEMLDRGMKYQEIAKETGVSTATISRVSRCLYYGENGYRTVLNRLKESNDL